MQEKKDDEFPEEMPAAEEILVEDVQKLEIILQQLQTSKDVYTSSTSMGRKNLQVLIALCNDVESDCIVIEGVLFGSNTSLEETDVKKQCKPLLLQVTQLLAQIRTILQEND